MTISRRTILAGGAAWALARAAMPDAAAATKPGVTVYKDPG